MKKHMESKVDMSVESPRKIIEENAHNISKETISFIRYVENQAYPEEMKMMQEDEDVEDISETYDVPIQQMIVVRGMDWYIIYSENHRYIEIVDIASLPTRDKDKSRREIHDYLIGVINKKAHDSNKAVILSAKEDTSYKMIQRMVRNHEYEIITDIADTWDYDSAIIMHDLVLNPLKTHVEIDQSSSGKK